MPHGGAAAPARGWKSRLGELPVRVGLAGSSRWISLGIVVVILAIDRVLLSGHYGFVARAVMDEPCHLLTGVLLLGTIVRWLGRVPGRSFVWAMLIASVAIDIDHLPAELAARGLFYGHLPRPYTHALWLLALMALIAVVAAWRARTPSRTRAAMLASVSAGVSWGLAAHFLRDLSTAPIALLWPVSGAWLRVSYGWYLAAMLLMVALPLRWRAWHRQA